MNKFLTIITSCFIFFSGLSGANAQVFLWANSIGNTFNKEGNGITVTPESLGGYVYITGYFEGTADFDPGAGTVDMTSAGNWDIFLAKYNADGNYIWAIRLGGTAWEEGYSIATDGSGNVWITGYFEGTVDFDPGTGTANLTASGSSDDIFLAKYDSDGNYLFAGKAGGGGFDYGMCIAVDTSGSGDCYLTGYFSGTVDFDPGAGTANLTSAGFDDVFFAKYDSNGNYVWAKRIGAGNTDYGKSIAIDPAGSGACYIAGEFRDTPDYDPGPGMANITSKGNYDIFIAKYDAGGNYLWAKGIGGAGSDNCNSIAIDPSGGAYCCITGYFSGTCDFDPDVPVTDLTSAAFTDVFFAKYDANGNYLWAKNIGGVGADFGNGIAIDPAGSGNVFITGYYRDTSDFDPGTDVVQFIPASAGYEDIFIAKYDANGNYLFAGSIGGTYIDKGKGIAADVSGNFYFTGFFSNTADFDPGSGIANLSSVAVNKYDVCFAKYKTNTITAVSDLKSVSVFFHPNPATGKATLSYTLPYNTNTNIEIINCLGQRVMNIVNSGQQKGVYVHEISFENEPGGIYFYKITAAGVSLSGKIVLMK